MEQALNGSVTKNPPTLLAAYAVGFSVLHLTANLLGWYYLYPWIDIFMHLGGGIWVAWTAIAYRWRIPGYTALPASIQALGVICFVALIGVLWELLEAAADVYGLRTQGALLREIPDLLGTARMGALWDTLYDLVNDILGAVIVSVIMLFKEWRKVR